MFTGLKLSGKSKLYSKFLIDCGHDSNHAYNAFKEVESDKGAGT